jgi:hypothetical protein
MADQEVTIKISAQNLSKEEFEAARQAILGIGTGSNEVKPKVDELKNSFDGLKNSGKDLGSALLELFTNPIQGVKDLTGALGGLAEGGLGALGGAAGFAAGALAAVGAAAAAVGATVFALADSAAGAGENVKAFSDKTGIAVQNVGPLEFSVKAAGGTLSDLSGILQKIDMKEATDSSGRFGAALKDIGINADAFKRMDSQQQIEALAKGFQTGSKSGNDMADAIAIMGRSGGENLPLLKRMTDEVVESGKTLGVQWTDDSVQASEKFSTGLRTIETAMGDVVTKIGSGILPAMADMISGFVSSPGFIDGVTEAASMLAEGLGTVVEWVGQATAAAIDMIGPYVAIGEFIGELFVDYWKAVIYEIEQFIGWFGQFQIVKDAVNGIGEMFNWLKDVANDVFSSVLTWLEALPVVGPKIKEAFDNAKDTFDKFAGAADTVRGVTGDLTNALQGNTISLGDEVGATEKANKAHGDAAENTAKFDKAVESLTQKLLGENASYLATTQAIDNAIAAGSQDVEVKSRIAEEIAKLISQHQQLSSVQQTFWEQNSTLTKQGQAGITLTTKLTDDYNTAYIRDTQGQSAAQLAANTAWYNGQKATIDKLTAAGQDMSKAEDALRSAKEQKDNQVLDAQWVKQQAFDDETTKLWNTHYATLAGLAGVDAATKNKIIDDQLKAEKDKLLLDTDITWTEYYARIAALDANAQDAKNKNLKDQAKSEKTQMDTNTLAWDGYYVELAKLHKTDVADAELKQSDDSFKAQIAALDPDKSGYQAAVDLLTARMALAHEAIATSYKEKAIQPIIDATSKTLYDGVTGGWDAIKQDLDNIWKQLLSLFITDFVSGVIGSASGVQNAWSSAFSNITTWYGNLTRSVGGGTSILSRVAGIGATTAAGGGIGGGSTAAVATGAADWAAGGGAGVEGLGGGDIAGAAGGAGAGSVIALGAGIAAPFIAEWLMDKYGKPTGDPNEANKSTDAQREADYNTYGSDPNNPTTYDLKWGSGGGSSGGGGQQPQGGGGPDDSGQPQAGGGGQQPQGGGGGPTSNGVAGGGMRPQGDTGGGPDDFGTPQFADGGIATKPTYGVFGERGSEALLPLSQYDSLMRSAGGNPELLKAIASEIRGLRGEMKTMPYTISRSVQHGVLLAAAS